MSRVFKVIREYIWELITVIAFILLFSPLLFLFFLNVRDLPRGATNGEWSAQLASGTARSHDIERLIVWGSNVVRAVIVSEETRQPFMYRRSCGYPGYRDSHTVYNIKIVEVFNGAWEVGNVVEVMQMQRIERRIYRRVWREVNASWVRIPIDIGDEFILILGVDQPGRLSPIRLDTIWGVYYYAPLDVRAGHDNWIFEPVNPHNNRVLTEQDLQYLLERQE